MKVGLVIHPVDINTVRRKFGEFYPFLSRFVGAYVKSCDDYSLKNFFPKVPTHKFVEIEVSKSLTIIGIMVPLFPIDMVRNKDLASKRIQEAFKIAARKKIDMLTLAAFTSIVSDGGDNVEKTYGVKYTSGNALTASCCMAGIKRALTIFRKSLGECRVAIIGATGDIGSVCTDYFVQHCKEVVMCARTLNEDNELYRRLTKLGLGKVRQTTDVGVAVDNADVILSVASSFGAIFDQDMLKSGAIICDAGMPANFSSSLTRKDVFVFEGGKSSWAMHDKIDNEVWRGLFPINSIFGCFAEALALASAGKLESFSTGKGKLTLDKVEEIELIARNNGFGLAEFSLGGYAYTQKNIADIKKLSGV